MRGKFVKYKKSEFWVAAKGKIQKVRRKELDAESGQEQGLQAFSVLIQSPCRMEAGKGLRGSLSSEFKKDH